jgi:tRNA A-37 threonylcarbamoyl transferase component Bud32
VQVSGGVAGVAVAGLDDHAACVSPCHTPRGWPPAAPSFIVLDVRLGDLEIVNLHASGGMAEVYRARVRDDDGVLHEYAVKKILPQFTRDADILRMFIEEARVAAFLHHECVVRVYDLCTSPSGEYYIVMEFADGKDFSDVIWEASQKRQVVPLGMTLLAAREVLRALDAAWHASDERGQQLRLIHRDVSPHNVLVTWDGRIKLTDFGIAKVAASAHKTQLGVIKGKFGYMSPEQARGRPLDQRSDLFAVGILLYEGFTGQRLFEGPTDVETLEAMRAAKVPRLAPELNVPADVEAVMRQALAKDPDRRFASARAFESALTDAARRCGVELRPAECAATMRRFFPTLAQGPVVQGTRQIELTSQLWQGGASVVAGGRAAPLAQSGMNDDGAAQGQGVLAGKKARRLDDRDATDEVIQTSVTGAGGARPIAAPPPLPTSSSGVSPPPPPLLPSTSPPPPVLAASPRVPTRLPTQAPPPPSMTPPMPPAMPLPLPPPPSPAPKRSPSTSPLPVDVRRPATSRSPPQPPSLGHPAVPPPPAGLVTSPPPLVRLDAASHEPIDGARLEPAIVPVAAESGFSLLDLPRVAAPHVDGRRESGPSGPPQTARASLWHLPRRARVGAAAVAVVGVMAGAAVGAFVPGLVPTSLSTTTRPVFVRTNPPGATVTIDDVPVAGLTPLFVDAVLDSGPHLVVIRLGSGPPVTRSVDVQPGAGVVVDVALAEAGTVSIETWPPGAAVSLDQRHVGKAPLALTDVSLVEPHVVTANAKGFRSATADLPAGRTDPFFLLLRLKPTAEVGEVVIETALPAELEVDGQPVGPTGREPLPLPLGVHAFVVRAPFVGFEKRFSTDVSSPGPLKLFISLD